MSLKINVTAEATSDAISIAEFLAGRSNLDTSDKFLSATTVKNMLNSHPFSDLIFQTHR